MELVLALDVAMQPSNKEKLAMMVTILTETDVQEIVNRLKLIGLAIYQFIPTNVTNVEINKNSIQKHVTMET